MSFDSDDVEDLLPLRGQVLSARLMDGVLVLFYPGGKVINIMFDDEGNIMVACARLHEC